MLSISRHNWSQLLSTLFVILLCGGAIAGLQMPQLSQLQTRSQNASVATIHSDIEAEQVKLALLQKSPALGFDNVLADWTFLRFLQYFGDTSARSKSDYQLSPEFFKVILEHNPYFTDAYTFLSVSTALYAGAPEQSVAIMKDSLQSLKPDVPPSSYYAWRQLGIDQLLFLGDAQAARQSFETAAAWARASSQPGSDVAAVVSQQTANFLAKNPKSKTAQVAVWTMVLSNAPDDRTRKIAISRIEKLGGRLIANPDGTFRVKPPAKD